MPWIDLTWCLENLEATKYWVLDIFRHSAIIWLPVITVLIVCLRGIHRQYTTNLIQLVVSPSLFLSSKWLIICEGSISGFFIWRCMHKASGMFFYIICFWEDIASSCMISEMIFLIRNKKAHLQSSLKCRKQKGMFFGKICIKKDLK